MTEKLKVACIGAGAAGTGHMVHLERYVPGCCVAFSDIDRSAFDKVASGYLDGDGSVYFGDLRTRDLTLRPDFRDLPYYADPEEMFEKEDINTVIIATYCNAHAKAVELCVKHGAEYLSGEADSYHRG